jgi:hypothetical protein
VVSDIILSHQKYMGRRASAAVHIEPAAHHLCICTAEPHRCIGKHHPQAAAAEQLDTLNTALHLEATNPRAAAPPNHSGGPHHLLYTTNGLHLVLLLGDDDIK